MWPNLTNFWPSYSHALLVMFSLIPSLRSIVIDLRHGIRLLRKAPGFSTIAILALALGIGANTAIFSTVDAALLRALPYTDSDRLVMVWQDGTFVGFPRATLTPADYSDWKRLNRVFSGMAAMRVVSASLTADGPPEQVEGQATTLAQARQDLHAIVRHSQEQGSFDERSDVLVTPLREDLLGNTRPALLVLLGAAGCVLLIACANLANLLLARSLARRREMAIRSALGAGRARLIRQMVTESVVLSIAGGSLGLGFAFAGVRTLAQLVPASMPETAVPSVDARLLVFAFALSLLTGLVFSIVPAIHTAKASLSEGLKQGGRGSSGVGYVMRDALVVAEIAAALVLLVGAGLLLRTMANLLSIDVGFRSDHLLTMRTAPARTMTHTDRLSYYDRVVAGVLALPGVEAAAFVSDLAFQQAGDSRAFQIEGHAPPKNGQVQLALYRVGTNDYLKTLGVKVLAGRLFERSDGPSSAPVVVITETPAKQFFRNENPLGHRLTVYGPDAPAMTIVGVVNDVHERGFEPAMMPGIYIPIAQAPHALSVPQNLIVRTKVDPTTLAESVRRVIGTVNPLQPVARVRTMDEWIALDVADRRQQTTLLGTFAGLALLLASIGLYGVLSYSVTRRSREIGVRMAVGATASDVTTMIVRHGLQVTAAGLTIGFALSWAAARALSKLLYGVRATDPATFASVAALLASIAVAACWIPARRASRVDPVRVLREE
jgi:putative ABC transport system permease protein